MDGLADLIRVDPNSDSSTEITWKQKKSPTQAVSENEKPKSESAITKLISVGDKLYAGNDLMGAVKAYSQAAVDSTDNAVIASLKKKLRGLQMEMQLQQFSQ